MNITRIIPTLCRIVIYSLTADDVVAITNSRKNSPTLGNPVYAGQRVPAVIVAVAEVPDSMPHDCKVNLRLMLDGLDVPMWIQNVRQADASDDEIFNEGTWMLPTQKPAVPAPQPPEDTGGYLRPRRSLGDGLTRLDEELAQSIPQPHMQNVIPTLGEELAQSQPVQVLTRPTEGMIPALHSALTKSGEVRMCITREYNTRMPAEADINTFFTLVGHSLGAKFQSWALVDYGYFIEGLFRAVEKPKAEPLCPLCLMNHPTDDQHCDRVRKDILAKAASPSVEPPAFSPGSAEAEGKPAVTTSEPSSASEGGNAPAAAESLQADVQAHNKTAEHVESPKPHGKGKHHK
jgi:hypothetical protein